MQDRIVTLFTCLLGAVLLTDACADEAKDKLIVETILRMESFDYQKAPEKVTAAVERFLAAQSGSDQYFAVIERFSITEQSKDLLTIALNDTGGKGTQAVQTLLRLKTSEQIRKALLSATTDEESRSRLMRSVALSGQPSALALLGDTAINDAPLSTRIAATKALGASRSGEKVLLELAAEKRIPADLAVTAASVLHKSTDPKIVEQATRHLEMPKSMDARPLPPISELATRSGDAAKGKAVYQRACFICHQIGTEGIAFGPALTKIGDKLPKEALYSSILEPSAAISFGFEGFEVELTDGSQRIGIIASETDSDLVLLVPGGASNTLLKSQIRDRKQLTASLMPESLPATMTETDLVDLIEYLITLKDKL